MNHLTTHKHPESSYLRAYRAPGNYRLSTVVYRLSSVLAPLHLSRVLGKSALFMQNKPNFPDTQMNVSKVLTRHYENDTAFKVRKNKPNQTQFPKGQNQLKLLFNKGL